MDYESCRFIKYEEIQMEKILLYLEIFLYYCKCTYCRTKLHCSVPVGTELFQEEKNKIYEK